MGDNDHKITDYTDSAANAPDAAALDKGKGKAADHPAQDMNMEEDDDDSSDEDEDLGGEDDEEEDQDNLEPISTENIIDDGRRTRGKRIDFAEAAEKAAAAGEDPMDDDDDEDDDFEGEERGDDEMRD